MATFIQGSGIEAPCSSLPLGVVGVGDKTEQLYDVSETTIASIAELQAITKPTASRANVYYNTPVGSAVSFASAAVKGIAIPCSQGDTFSWKEFGTISSVRRVYTEVDTDGKVLLTRVTYTSSGLSYTVANADCAYLLIEWSIDATDNAEMVVVEGSTIPSAFIPYGYKFPIKLNNAIVGTIYDDTELLNIGSVLDSMASGVRTNRIGCKVFDGTEDFTSSGILDNCWCWATTLDSDTTFTNRTVYCTHYMSSEALPSSSARQGYALLGKKTGGSDAGKYVGFGTTTDYSTLSAWQAYLAAQYAAGTPVTIWYPLATATTESVSMPTISTAAGTNYIDLETEVKGSMSVTYKSTSASQNGSTLTLGSVGANQTNSEVDVNG